MVEVHKELPLSIWWIVLPFFVKLNLVYQTKLLGICNTIEITILFHNSFRREGSCLSPLPENCIEHHGDLLANDHLWYRYYLFF